MNIIIEATKLEPETTFENKIDEIKSDHKKSIASLGMNLSAITSNKNYVSSEHLNADIIPWIVLQSPGKSPLCTKHFSSMHLKGNTQLKFLKCWVALISEFIIYLLSYFWKCLSANSTRRTKEKTLKNKCHFFKTSMIHPLTVPMPNVRLKIFSEI